MNNLSLLILDIVKSHRKVGLKKHETEMAKKTEVDTRRRKKEETDVF